jgi:protein-arginine kinase activator protein McsA
MQKLIVCNKCGWNHFSRTRKEVEIETRSFGDYIQKQTPKTQENFGLGPLSKNKKEWSFENQMKSSEHCFNCGNDHKDFHEATDKDKVPMGCTLQGIIVD